MTDLEKQTATAAHWSLEQWEQVFRQPNSGRVALVIQEPLEKRETSQSAERPLAENKIQGFVIARVVDREWEIENIVIAGSARRQGLGTGLLRELMKLAEIQGADAVLLEVRESNRAAREFYQKNSFVEAGRRKNYYQDPPEDAILYRLGFA
jgi:ribosomal-protein-alanine acetyltransferase